MFPEGRILDFLIVGVVALIVVGPKDLPILMRRVGRFVAHMRSMAAEFRASFEDMARQSELDDLRREVEALRAGQPLQAAAGIDADGDGRKVLDDIAQHMDSATLPQIVADAPAPATSVAPGPESSETVTAAKDVS